MRAGFDIAVLARAFRCRDGVVYRQDAPTVAVYGPERIEEEVRAAFSLTVGGDRGYP